MKLFIYQKIQSSAELVLSVFDRLYIWFRFIQLWAWKRAVDENLKKVMSGKNRM